MRGQDSELELVVRALEFAAGKHRYQRRKDRESSPYINHPIALVHILCHEGGVVDAEILCAALLHDTVEDTATTLEELEREFGPVVRSLVEEVSDDKTLPKERRKQLQIEHAPRLSVKARHVKLADKISNLRDLASSPPAGWSLERRQEYFDWAKRVVDQIRGTHQLLERLFDDAHSERPG